MSENFYSLNHDRIRWLGFVIFLKTIQTNAGMKNILTYLRAFKLKEKSRIIFTREVIRGFMTSLHNFSANIIRLI